ncbi:MAG TPA: hypothetical protein PLR25_20940, partial [Planctomycetaceae bacterium]|nr:hypothetical protein [Planctomycetaceae bacterium]
PATERRFKTSHYESCEMSLTLSTEIFSVDRGQTCRIGYQWHKHRQYKHLWRPGNRIERFRGLWELTVAPSQKLCLKFKTSRPCGNRPPGLTLHLSFVQFVHSTRKREKVLLHSLIERL